MHCFSKQDNCLYGKAGGNTVVQALREDQTITSISLRHHWLRSEGVSVIADYLENNHHSTVKEIDLTSNQLDNATILRLTRTLLSPRVQLSALTLTRNELTHVGLADFARAVSASQYLTYLHLANNPLGNTGVCLLFDTFSSANTNICLRYLNLSMVNATDDCIPSIARFLAKNPSLECLVLNGNDYTNQGIEILVQILGGDDQKPSPNTHLITLELSGAWYHEGSTSGDTTPELSQRLEAILARNRSLKAKTQEAAVGLLCGARLVFNARPAVVSNPEHSASKISTVSTASNSLATLNTDVKGMILRALDATGVLSTAQRLSVMRYAENRGTLAESKVESRAEFLERVGCLFYS